LREKGAPEEDVALAKRVYALEKRRAHTAKDALMKAIEILEQESDQEEPKQLGKTPEEWRKAHQKPECRHLRTKLMVLKGDRRMQKCSDCGLEIWSEKRD
jgi:hypothetical protein